MRQKLSKNTIEFTLYWLSTAGQSVVYIPSKAPLEKMKFSFVTNFSFVGIDKVLCMHLFTKASYSDLFL